MTYRIQLPAVLEANAFSSLLMSVVEIPGTESMGLLLGHEDKRFIVNKFRSCVAIDLAYPIQTAERARTSVTYGNLAARNRLHSTVSAVGFAIVGGFHSHPNTNTRLTKEDKDFIFNELSLLKSKQGLEKWLEIVVKVSRIKNPSASKHLSRMYKNEKMPEPGFYLLNNNPEITGHLIIDPSNVYRLEMKGYWFSGKRISEAMLYL
ncbi:MAG: hypothetical protein QHH00_01895 [Methanomassiliicoccales archaeon]|jgi:proteasome lid subunit RPN8/RPN11|nr:hypothetical protein [Methanomassiliicoccales archaeon]